MAFVIVIGGAVVAAVAIAVALRAAQLRAASRMVVLDADLEQVEAESGRCGACLGEGYRWESLGGGGGTRRHVCWRCQGTGLPPTDADRARFLPADPS